MVLTTYASESIVKPTTWIVRLAEEFEPEFAELPPDVQDELLALAKFLQQFGPVLERRVAFAFDRRRQAILLVRQ